MNFGEVRRAQLAKSTLLTSTLVPLDLFRSFKACLDAKERLGCGKQREATAPIKSLVKLQPRFLRLQWRTCPWAEHTDEDKKYDVIGFSLKIHWNYTNIVYFKFACDRRLIYCINKLSNLVQIWYLKFSCKYLEVFFSFSTN